LDEDEEDGVLLPEPIGFDPPRWKDHRIHEPEYCWCEASAIAAFSHGILQRFYVIEIVINQWDKNNPQNASLIREDVCDKRLPSIMHTPFYGLSKPEFRNNSYRGHQLKEENPVNGFGG